MINRALFFGLCFFVAFVGFVYPRSPKPTTKLPDSKMAITFKAIWTNTKNNIYDIDRAKKYFTQERYKKLLSQAKKTKNIESLQRLINKFFKAVNISHLQVMTESNASYYFLKSAFPGRQASMWHIGTFIKKKGTQYVISSVLEGYPGNKANLQRGDIIISVDGRSYNPTTSFINKKSANVKIQRGSQILNKNIKVVYEPLHNSFLKATINSAKIITTKRGNKVGYIHIWSFAYRRMFHSIHQVFKSKLSKIDALVLDLRYGFGGSWAPYREFFCYRRKLHFKLEYLDRNKKRHTSVPSRYFGLTPFTKPMSVIINNETRSAKEFLVYQMKKSKRATIIGEKTAGAFTAARLPLFKQDYLLMVPFREMIVGGMRLEGVGVIPDLKVAQISHDGEKRATSRAIEIVDAKLSKPKHQRR